VADKNNSADGLDEVNSKPRQAQRKKDSTAPRADSGLPVLAIIEPLSLEASGAGQRGYQKMGWGEFEPADGARSVDYIRYLFLEEIRERERAENSLRSGRKRLEVLKELGAAPLIEFEKAKPSKKKLHRLYANPYSGVEPRLLTLQKAVENWARRWHLDAAWCLSAAFATLQLWSDYPEAHKLLLWDNNFPMDEATLLLPKEVADTAPFPGLPPFFAHIELRSAYTTRMKERIKRQLETDPLTAKVGRKLQRLILSADIKEVKAYCVRVMSFYESQRDRQGAPVWKRVRERAALGRDIRWAIEFQVRGRSTRAIALEEEIERNLSGIIQGLPHTTVSRSVNFILELIDLPKRA
jgi:hypothetical protein